MAKFKVGQVVACSLKHVKKAYHYISGIALDTDFDPPQYVYSVNGELAVRKSSGYWKHLMFLEEDLRALTPREAGVRKTKQ